MDISLELYRVFYEVAKTSSFSRAAENLYVSQPAVSQSIKSLETKLGFKLFVRTTKSVALTLDGRVLAAHLKQAFAIISNAESQLKDQQNPFKGELTIASTDTLCKYFLLPKIKTLHMKYPEVVIKIINGTSLYCLELLAAAKTDIAVINIPKRMDNKLFEIKKSNRFKDVFVASKTLGLPKKMTLQEIAKKPLLVLDDKSVTRRFLDDLFANAGIIIEPEIELQNIDILLEMAKIGLGISFVPDICVKDQSLEIIETHEDIPPRKYGVVALKQLPLKAVTNTFLKMCIV